MNKDFCSVVLPNSFLLLMCDKDFLSYNMCKRWKIIHSAAPVRHVLVFLSVCKSSLLKGVSLTLASASACATDVARNHYTNPHFSMQRLPIQLSNDYWICFVFHIILILLIYVVRCIETLFTIPVGSGILQWLCYSVHGAEKQLFMCGVDPRNKRASIYLR